MSTIEKFISNWNEEFSNYTLQVADLKNPHSVIEGLLQLFERLGINSDAITKPPPESEQDDHTIYYWDLLTVINIVRVINHFNVTYLKNAISTNIIQILQPTATSSHPLLLLLFNLMIFNNDWVVKMEPKEAIIFSKKNELLNLEEEDAKFIQELNDYAVEKATRNSTADQLESANKKLEQDFKEVNVALKEETLQTEAALEEKRQSEIVVEQKRLQKDELLDEIVHKKALRVYKADDVRVKLEKANADLKESVEKVNALTALLAQKENNLKNLQTVKPQFELGTKLINEITMFKEDFKDQCDMKTGDKKLDSVNKEVQELQTQLIELQAEREEQAARRRENQSRRNLIETREQNTLKEEEERFNKLFETTTAEVTLNQDLLKMKNTYEEERKKDLESLVEMRDTFNRELDVMEETLFARLVQVANTIEEKCRDSAS